VGEGDEAVAYTVQTWGPSKDNKTEKGRSSEGRQVGGLQDFDKRIKDKATFHGLGGGVDVVVDIEKS